MGVVFTSAVQVPPKAVRSSSSFSSQFRVLIHEEIGTSSQIQRSLQSAYDYSISISNDMQSLDSALVSSFDVAIVDSALFADNALLRSRLHSQCASVVYLVNLNDVAGRQTVSSQGFHFIAKPIHHQQLIGIVEKMLFNTSDATTAPSALSDTCSFLPKDVLPCTYSVATSESEIELSPTSVSRSTFFAGNAGDSRSNASVIVSSSLESKSNRAPGDLSFYFFVLTSLN